MPQDMAIHRYSNVCVDNGTQSAYIVGGGQSDIVNDFALSSGAALRSNLRPFPNALRLTGRYILEQSDEIFKDLIYTYSPLESFLRYPFKHVNRLVIVWTESVAIEVQLRPDNLAEIFAITSTARNDHELPCG